MIALVLALVAAQSASGEGSDLQPATAAAIVAAGKACIGATVDPAGEDARLAGWTDATAGQKAGMKSDGRVVTRDNVMLIVKPGIDGGCVVQAKTMTGFDQKAFVADLSTVAGMPIVTDAKKPITNLANGEMLITMVGGDAVQLVVANPNNKHVKKAQGN